MSENTFHTTKEDIRKPASQESHAHGGHQQPKAGSDVAAMQSIVDTEQDKSKAQTIEGRKSNLPLPEDPPVPSDFNSADQSTTAVGSGGVNTAPRSVGGDAMADNPTGDSAARTAPGATHSNVETGPIGREGLEGGIPNDAVARGSKDHAGLKDTTGKDYGYPHKNDPTSKSS